MSHREVLTVRDTKGVITSTEMPVLFGVEKYKTLYQLLWEKQNIPEEIPDNPRMKFGRVLEPAIAKLASEELFLQVAPYKKFLRWNEHKIASSFDYLILGVNTGAVALLECKNVDSNVFYNEWWEDEKNGLMAPDHIEIQCQHQMLVYGINDLYIAALVGGNELHLLKRKLSPEMADLIKEKSKKFWEVDMMTPLEEFAITPKNADFVFSRLSSKNLGPPYEDVLREFSPLVNKHNDLTSKRNDLDKQIKENKAHIAKLASGHQKIIGDGYKITFSHIKQKMVPATMRKSYTTMRITTRRDK